MKSLRLKIISGFVVVILLFTTAAIFGLNQLGHLTADGTGTGNTFVLTVIIISVLVSLTIAIVLSNRIVKPIFQVVDRMKMVAEGDLSAKLLETKSKDEIGQLVQSMNEMILNLRNVVGEVRNTAEQVAASSEELTASADQTTVATEQVASVIQQVASGAETQTNGIE
ncbi:HAMP domain-containing protein, partial [Parageobacillus thermoglucosidasius]